MTNTAKRWGYALWLILICGFAVLHALNLRADFPNHSPWVADWAKYTDEGWYGDAAIRAHLFGHWYVPGDFNAAVAVPVWPFLEWLLFLFTGVTVQAARGLAIAVFFANLVLGYWLLRARGPRWMALLAVTLVVTSPFLYCFSRLAILEPLLTALTLGSLNLAVRLPRFRRPILVSAGIGVLYTLMMLTKTTAIFLLPAMGWALLIPLWHRRRLAVHCALGAAGAAAVTFGAWMVLIASRGLLEDYKYYFFINKYPRPPELYWPVVSFWWSLHGCLWIDHILVPLAGVLGLGAAVGAALCWRGTGLQAEGTAAAEWGARGQRLLLDPVFGASLWAVAGCVVFMTYQDHPQPRYFALAAFFVCFAVAQGAEALVCQAALRTDPAGAHALRLLGAGVIAIAVLAATINSAWTLNYAAHPEYTFVSAVERLTRYIDEHPNGRRLLVSVSGDDISLISHLPTLCDDFGTEQLVQKLADYQPGWYATWNDLDPGTLEDLHVRYSLEQVASFRAFDDTERNQLVLFKLHPLPGGQVREPSEQNLQIPVSGDRIEIPVQ